MRHEEPLRCKIKHFRHVVILLVLTLAFSCASGGEAGVHEHWKRPVNTGPSSSVLPLYPESCARCHPSQYADWKGALHSKSVGPGLIAQLNPETDPETAISCYYCHAPLASQSEVTAGEEGQGLKSRPNDAFDERLKLSGVSCAVCHVREGAVFGHGHKAAPEPGHASDRSIFFKEAEFCAACHQLDKGFELNGKPLVNTFREWEESDYGKKKITCQDCHMPKRRHLFRGIHDPEMVKGGVRFEVKETAAGAKLTIINSGVGHCLPTYVTPLIVVRGFLTGPEGRLLKGTMKEAAIGRKVSLDLSREDFDTRIPPGKGFVFDYSVKRPAEAERIVFEVRVVPDEFYNRFFKDAVMRKDAGMKGHELKQALKDTSGSDFLIFRKELPLEGHLPGRTHPM